MISLPSPFLRCLYRSLVPSFCCFAAVATGQPTPTIHSAGPAISNGGLKPLVFAEGRVTLDVTERLRFEDRTNNFDFDATAHSPTDDSWFVQRLRLGLVYKVDPNWSFQLQLQDAREWGAERPNVPFILGAEGDDALDLRLAALTWGDPKTSPIVVTLGRQILALGEERLIGVGEWNNFARTFDAAKLVWSAVPNTTTVTAFVASVVTVRGTSEDHSWKFDRADLDDVLSGIYLAQKLTPAEQIEGYLLWRDKKDNNPIYSAPTAAIPAPARTAAAYDIGQDVFTVGSRFIRPPKAGALDTEFEVAYQFGDVDRQTTAAAGPYAGNKSKLDQSAWALHTLAGYTPAHAPGSLRVTLEYNLASGDTDRADGENGSFMNLFPSNHKFYGFMDVFAWKNLREVVATLRFTPAPKTTARIDYHHFSLYTSQDAWYRANGVATVRPLNAAAQRAPTSAGQEIDVTVTWTPRPWVTVDTGWSHFFAGSYLRATGAGNGADFIYVQTTLKR